MVKNRGGFMKRVYFYLFLFSILLVGTSGKKKDRINLFVKSLKVDPTVFFKNMVIEQRADSYLFQWTIDSFPEFEERKYIHSIGASVDGLSGSNGNSHIVLISERNRQLWNLTSNELKFIKKDVYRIYKEMINNNISAIDGNLFLKDYIQLKTYDGDVLIFCLSTCDINQFNNSRFEKINENVFWKKR